MLDTEVIRCFACGSLNRVQPEKMRQGRKPICAMCKAALESDGKPLTVTDSTFADQVEHSSLPVLVDLWAPWCGPCRMVAPILEEVASEMAGSIRVAKLNVDENPQTAARFKVQGIPTLLAIKDGREVDRMVGVQPKAEIVRRLRQLVA